MTKIIVFATQGDDYFRLSSLLFNLSLYSKNNRDFMFIPCYPCANNRSTIN